MRRLILQTGGRGRMEQRAHRGVFRSALKLLRSRDKKQEIAPAPLPYVAVYAYDRCEYFYTREFVPPAIIFDGDDSVGHADFK